MTEKIQSLETELVSIRTVTVTEAVTEPVTEPVTETDDSSTSVEPTSEVRVKLVRPPRQVGHLHKEILTGNFSVCCR